MKPPAPASLGLKLAHVKISLAVDLCQPEKCYVQTAAIVEIELIGLVDDCVGVGRRPEI